LFGDAIKWNFAKFLVDRQGNVVDRYAPTTSPLEIEVSRSFPSYISLIIKGAYSVVFSFFFSQKDIVKLLASA